MANTPNWVSVTPLMGYPDVGTVDDGRVNASDGLTYPSVPIGTMAWFRDNGTTGLGGGCFIFLPGVTATVANDVVDYATGNGTTPGAGGDVNGGAVTRRWTGGSSTGLPLAVATAATNIQTKWGWYQIQGGAIVNVTGTTTAGASAYFGQVATLGTTVAGGKQVLGARAAGTAGTPNLDAGKAVFTLNNPTVQSQIT